MAAGFFSSSIVQHLLVQQQSRSVNYGCAGMRNGVFWFIMLFETSFLWQYRTELDISVYMYALALAVLVGWCTTLVTTAGWTTREKHCLKTIVSDYPVRYLSIYQMITKCLCRRIQFGTDIYAAFEWGHINLWTHRGLFSTCGLTFYPDEQSIVMETNMGFPATARKQFRMK